MLSLSLLREHCKFIRLFLTRREVNLASELCNQHCTMIRERPWNTWVEQKRDYQCITLFFSFFLSYPRKHIPVFTSWVIGSNTPTRTPGRYSCMLPWRHTAGAYQPVHIVVIGNNLTNAWTLLVDCSKGHHTTSTTLQDCEVRIVNNAATFEWL